MKFDIQKVMNYHKTYEDYKTISSNAFKHLLLCLIGCIIPILNIVFGPLYNILITGYFCKNANFRLHEKKYKIPEWNFKEVIKTGLPLLLLWIATGTISVIFIFAIIVSSAFASSSSETQIILSCIVIAVFGILYILVACFYPIAAILSYSIKLNPASMVDFKYIKFILFDNFNSFIKLIGWSFLYGISFLALAILLSVTLIGIFFIPKVQFRYIMIFSELCAQYLRSIFRVGQKAEQPQSNRNTEDKNEV